MSTTSRLYQPHLPRQSLLINQRPNLLNLPFPEPIKHKFLKGDPLSIGCQPPNLLSQHTILKPDPTRNLSSLGIDNQLLNIEMEILDRIQVPRDHILILDTCHLGPIVYDGVVDEWGELMDMTRVDGAYVVAEMCFQVCWGCHFCCCRGHAVLQTVTKQFRGYLKCSTRASIVHSYLEVCIVL